MEDSEVSKYQLITQPTLDKFLPHFCQILFKLDGFISHCYHESHRGKRFETRAINGLASSYLILVVLAGVRVQPTSWGTTAATRVPRRRIGERPREVAQEGSTG